MMKKNIFDSPLFWGILGPFLLSCCFGLFYLKSAHLNYSPIWSIGISLACMLALAILLFSLWDLHLDFSMLKRKKKEAKTELAHVKEVLQKMQIIDRSSNQNETVLLEQNYLNQIQALTHKQEEESEQLRKAYERAFEEATENKHRATSLQISLEEALTQLGQKRQLEYLEKELRKTIDEICQSAVPPKEKVSHPQLVAQCEQFRKQFEEKSAILNETRKELFHLENHFLALQKERELKALEMSEMEGSYFSHLNELDKENAELETQVTVLEELIAQVVAPKKRTPRTKKNQKTSAEIPKEESLNLF